MSFTIHPSPRRIARAALSLGTAAALVAPLGTPASFAAPAKTNGAERAKAHTTISSLSSAQQKAGFNRFVITYTDSSLNAGGINWASPTGTQVATWSDALYSGISSDVKSIDNLLKVKTSYVRTTAQKATVVTLSSKLSAEPAEKYMAALSSNPSVASVEPDLLRRSNARARGAANSKVAQAANTAQAVAPNDTLYPWQWNLHGTRGLAAPEAWKTTQGAGVTVAVIDSGIVKHPDLDANVVPGHDFITEPAIARDGNDRDSNPTDQGNWEEAGVCDAGGTEAVVVAVDRPDAVVFGGNVRGGVDDVLAELVVGEGASQQGCVVELDVCYEGDDRIRAAAGGVGGDGDRAFVSGEALAVDLHAGQFGGVCSG